MHLSASQPALLGGIVAIGLLVGVSAAGPSRELGRASDGSTAPSTVARAGESGTGAGVQPGTTLDDQVDLALTVYNSNVALVRDVRELTLPAGVFDLSFIDVAATINPATVRFRSLTEPGMLSVLEQNYEYDLLDPQKLLQKYVGREVTLVRNRQDAGTTITEEVRARLLALNNGPVWQVGSEIVTGMHADHIRFPALPENLYTHPTMVWTLNNNGEDQHRVEATYLAGGLSWNADYVLTVARDNTRAELDGWVTLTNTSGTAFNNTRLQLVAGDLHRIQPQRNKAAQSVDRFRCARRETVRRGGPAVLLPQPGSIRCHRSRIRSRFTCA